MTENKPAYLPSDAVLETMAEFFYAAKVSSGSWEYIHVEAKVGYVLAIKAALKATYEQHGLVLGVEKDLAEVDDLICKYGIDTIGTGPGVSKAEDHRVDKIVEAAYDRHEERIKQKEIPSVRSTPAADTGVSSLGCDSSPQGEATPREGMRSENKILSGILSGLKSSLDLIEGKFKRAGGVFKVAHDGVQLGAASWASNVENGIHNAYVYLEELQNTLSSQSAQVDALREALAGLVEGCTQEFNEKGAGGYALARLADAKTALALPAPAPVNEKETP